MRASLIVCISSLSLAATSAFAEGAPEGHPQAAEATTSSPANEQHPAEIHAAGAEHHEAAHESAEENWDLGAGLGLGFIGFGQTGVSAPNVGVAIERRVARATWLTLGAHGLVQHRSGDGVGASLGQSLFGSGSSQTVTGSTDVLSLGANVGVRHVLNPEGVVEVSVLANLGVGYAHGSAQADLTTTGFTGTPPTKEHRDTTQSAQRVGLEAGLSAEKKLAENLGVRIELGLLGAGYDHDSDETTVTPEGGKATTDKADSSGFDVGLRPSATLSLHLMF